jgi:GntR family transcriptional repressor for pyruvate dehydrogenase complex
VAALVDSGVRKENFATCDVGLSRRVLREFLYAIYRRYGGVTSNGDHVLVYATIIYCWLNSWCGEGLIMSAVTPLAPQRAARIATQLMELIELQKLSPGDKLPPERQLADLLEVSRPSLREALHILQAQGLVQIKHGQGTFVQEPVVAQELRASVMTKTHGLNELFDAREVLEVPASRWAAEKATKEDIRLLRATLNQIDTVTAIEPIDFDQLQSLDAKFHLTIVGIAGNRFINQTLNVLQDVMRMSMETTLRLPGRSEISRNEHNEILKAIETGNGELASKLTLQHITGARVTALADAKMKDNN